MPDASSTVVVCAYGRRFVAVAVTGRQTMALCKVVRDEPTPSGRRRFLVETPLSDWIMMRGTVRDNGSLRIQILAARTDA
jgi:hypothetical protein